MSTSRVSSKAKIHTILYLLIIILTILVYILFEAKKNSVTISIIHTDTLYGGILGQNISSGPLKDHNIGGISKLSSIIRDLKSDITTKKGIPFIVDAGSSLLSGNSLLDHETGKVMITAFNHIGYDVVNLGDLDLSLKAIDLFGLLQKAKFSYISANTIQEENLKHIYRLMPYKVISREGIKIAFLGLSNSNMKNIVQKENTIGLSFIPSKEVVKENLLEIKKLYSPDIIVLLSDLYNLDEEKSLLEEFSDIDLILATTPFSQDEKHEFTIHNKHLIKTPRKIKHVGIYEFSYDLKNKKILSKSWNRLPILSEKEDATMVQLMQEYKAKINPPVYDYPIGKSLVYMPYETIRMGLFGNFVTDVMRQKGKADLAFINSPNLLDLPEGDLSVGTLMKSIPYDQKLYLVELTGREVKNVLETSYGQIPNIGILQISGIKVKYHLSSPKGEMVKEISNLSNQPLNLNKKYTAVITEFLLNGGDNFFTFSNSKEIKDLNMSLRSLIINEIREIKNIHMEYDDRMVEIKEKK